MLVHIFNTTGKRDLDLEISYEDMVKRTNDDIEGASEIIELVNNSPKAKQSAEKFLNKSYVMMDKDGRYFINDMLIKLDLFTFKLEQSIYKNGISIVKHYNKNGIITNTPNYERFNENLTNTAKKISFKDAFLQYVEAMNNPFSLGVEVLVKAQPLIVDAFHKLGADRVRSLRYIKKDVEAALVNIDDDKSIENKIAKVLASKISVGFISNADIQIALASTYSSLDLDRKVKATAITNYYDCKPASKRVDGKKVAGYEIYRSKIIFK